MERDWTFIWICAVYVNRGNMQERSHQVQLIKHIYQGAECTIVWLGLQTRDSSLAVAKVSRLAESWNRRFQNKEEHYQFLPGSKTKEHYSLLLQDEVGEDPAAWAAK